jgi:predicted dehydrogenase
LAATGERLRILIGDDWRDGYLDEHRSEGDVRIRAQALLTVDALHDLYFVRDRSLWRLWNYLREVGLLWVVRKVLSRVKESSRNRKFLSVGCGVVIEAPPGAGFDPGAPVVFVAPCHPRAFERIVLPPVLVSPLKALPSWVTADSMALDDGSPSVAGLVGDVGGWSTFSGRALDHDRLRHALAGVASALQEHDWSAARRLPASTSSAIAERDGSPPPAAGPSAALFGYGNYGKAIVLNNVRHALRIAAIHEIDPTLLPPGRERGIRWDTAALPREDERYDVYLIASYHHTHVPLAVDALGKGAAAVVEKPIATTRAHLEELTASLRATNGRFFAGFHKRYAPLNELARRDLGVGAGEPVHYHAIAFEEPLPARHWYRWPRSCSRIVSNGCHWLDHFLFLNDWSEPTGIEVARGSSGTEVANVSVRLANGAFFSLVLTDTGSARVGVRDHIELRAAGVTVTMDDSARYLSESGKRILRRAHVNKMTSYRSMYRTIADRIVRGEAGDTLRSIQVSAGLVLEVEEAYRAASR